MRKTDFFLRGVASVIFFGAVSPLFSFHVVDAIGGSGFSWAGFSRQSYLIGAGTTKFETPETIYLRENVFMGLRYSNYRPKADGFFIIGGEISGTIGQAAADSTWKYTKWDADKKITAQNAVAAAESNSPSLQVIRGSFHLGWHMPVSSSFGYEMGFVAGLSGGKAKYTVASGGESVSDTSGVGFHAMLRFGLQYLPMETMRIMLEYRGMAEFFGGFSFFPGLTSGTNIATLTGHTFSLSIGYRFGSGTQLPVVPD